MSYMNNEMVWADAGIQEMSLDEIDNVNGGWVVLAAVVVVALCLVALGAIGAHNKAEAAE